MLGDSGPFSGVLEVSLASGRVIMPAFLCRLFQAPTDLTISGEGKSLPTIQRDHGQAREKL